MPSRRQLLVGCSSVVGSSLAGCLGDSDTDSDESNTDDDSGEVGGYPAPPTPAEHPEFDGVTNGSGGGPVLTWITDASDSDQVLDVAGNSWDITQYIDETDFDEYGILVYNERIQAHCIMIDIPTTTVENGQLYADATYEWPDDCHHSSRSTFVAYMLRVPVEDPPAEALLDRGYFHSTVSNRYRVEVEEVTQDSTILNNRIIDEDELAEPVLEEIRSAIDEPFERYNPPALITTSPGRYGDMVRIDGTPYIASVTDVLGSHTKEWG